MDTTSTYNLKGLPEEDCMSLLSLDWLQICLGEFIKDKKFLLVLDDVWNEDRKKWIKLENLLVGECKGSKILVTTRSSSVATVMGTTTTYNLKGLPEADCMSLFVKLAMFCILFCFSKGLQLQ